MVRTCVFIHGSPSTMNKRKQIAQRSIFTIPSIINVCCDTHFSTKHSFLPYFLIDMRNLQQCFISAHLHSCHAISKRHPSFFPKTRCLIKFPRPNNGRSFPENCTSEHKTAERNMRTFHRPDEAIGG